MLLMQSNNNYESFMKSDKEVPIADLTDQIHIYPLMIMRLLLLNRVSEIRYSALPIKYLPTSKQGIAIVFNIGSWESYDSFFNNYQRGHPSRGGFLHHYSDNTVQEGSIIKHQCNIKYYKIIPYNIKECPYVILISKGIHKHSPPLPTKIPNETTNKLKDIIKESSEELVNITSQKLVS
ncbi:13918_t:CDS:2, partial [Cetraspora pellucida]